MSLPLCESIDLAFKAFSQYTAITQHQSNGKSITTTYEGLEVLAGKVFGLFGNSLKADQCIGLYMQRTVEHVAAIVASLYVKSPYTTINNLVSARQVCRIAQDSNLKLLICDNATILKLRLLTQEEAGQKVLASIRIVHFRQTEVLSPAHKQTVALLARFTDIESMVLAEAKPYTLQVAKAEKIDRAKLILFTSGSTGNPKGVMISGGDLVDRATSEAKAYDLQETDTLLSMLPFSFDVGCNQLYTSLINGCNLVLLNSWMPKDIVSAIVAYQITGVSGVPSLWLSVVGSDADMLMQANATLRYITISGGDMADKDRLALRTALPDVQIFKTYGQTESFRSSMLLAKDFDAKHGSVGKAVDGVTITIVDEVGQPLPLGEVGQVVHQGIGTMLGYIGDKDATHQKLRPLSATLHSAGEKVIYTGDLGWLDEDGFLYLQGRQDKMFKVRGNRVYPEEIERELCMHEEVIEAVSVYSKAEDSITIFVRKKTNSTLVERDVIKFLSTRLPSYMLPSQCLLYDDFPRTASGKTDVPMLTALMK